MSSRTFKISGAALEQVLEALNCGLASHMYAIDMYSRSDCREFYIGRKNKIRAAIALIEKATADKNPTPNNLEKK